MTQDDLLKKIDKRLERMEGGISTIKTEQARQGERLNHMDTGIDAVKAGLEDVQIKNGYFSKLFVLYFLAEKV